MRKPGQITAMISSTAVDLPEHREKVHEACLRQGVFPIAMEQLPTRDATGIQASLEMVDQADVYIGIYAWRYGWIPEFENPAEISITEMEFNRALKRKQQGALREILIFVMHEDHPIRASDKEDGERAQQKLRALKERASTGRIRSTFESADDLHGKVVQALADLNQRDTQASGRDGAIPAPPALYAEPAYIGSHRFVGRNAQLRELDAWAAETNPTQLLLFEAIGGNGKSMLTWEWITNPQHAVAQREWAGRFWYSFYEQGAAMADFCRRAIAYMTARSLDELQGDPMSFLTRELLALLRERPWLIVLDGVERILVAYHRIDAAQVPDEEANAPTDRVLDRNPCDTIRDEDGELLRRLAGAEPSKVLVSSRLTPRVLVNQVDQAIPGVRRIALPGLRPADAEDLFRSCDIRGRSLTIRDYLTEHCDNHPLVIGVLAGLVSSYLPDRGNFDAWLEDAGAQGGANLDPSALDLVQSRNHILHAALDNLPSQSRELLSTLALISESVDYDTLAALNPHRSPAPSDDFDREVPTSLGTTVQDLERRGLLQFDRRTNRYDLHPVVRAVAARRMTPDEETSRGQRVIDHFSSVRRSPYELAKTLEDLKSGLQVVRTLQRLGRLDEAAQVLFSGLLQALQFSLEAHAEAVSVLRPFFSDGWGVLPGGVRNTHARELATQAGIALRWCDETDSAIAAYGAVIAAALREHDTRALRAAVANTGVILQHVNRLARALELKSLALDLAHADGEWWDVFASLSLLFELQSRLGRWEDADRIWDDLQRMRHLAVNRQGELEGYLARAQLWRGELEDAQIERALDLSESENDRYMIRDLHRLRGAWCLDREDWEGALASLHEALAMARERRLSDELSEIGLALAKHRLGQLGDPREARAEAKRLRGGPSGAHRYLALLWLGLGDAERARRHAESGFRWAWADGEPFVHRYELAKTTELMHEMGVPVPDLPRYDSARDGTFGWEVDVRSAIERLQGARH